MVNFSHNCDKQSKTGKLDKICLCVDRIVTGFRLESYLLTAYSIHFNTGYLTETFTSPVWQNWLKNNKPGEKDTR